MTYDQSILLTGNQWASLSDGQKVQVLQAIENHSAYEAGRITCPVVDKFLYTGTDGVVLGTYDPQNRVIYVNSSQFDPESKYGKTSETIITTCLHEGRHAYQHQVADGIVEHDDPTEAAIWKENLAEGNYISFRENPKAYYNQPVEVDARAFAAEKYAELVASREQLSYSDTYHNNPLEVFERQLSSEATGVVQKEEPFSETESESAGLSIH